MISLALAAALLAAAGVSYFLNDMRIGLVALALLLLVYAVGSFTSYWISTAYLFGVTSAWAGVVILKH
jgi:hypothetical protein